MRTFIVYIFVFLMSLLLFSCGEYYSKYKITGVELKHINMIDSTSHNKEYYLLSFNVEWCEPEIRFFTGPGVSMNKTILSQKSLRVGIYSKCVL